MTMLKTASILTRVIKRAAEAATPVKSTVKTPVKSTVKTPSKQPVIADWGNSWESESNAEYRRAASAASKSNKR